MKKRLYGLTALIVTVSLISSMWIGRGNTQAKDSEAAML